VTFLDALAAEARELRLLDPLPPPAWLAASAPAVAPSLGDERALHP
jgi:hypothetical protein